MDKLKILAIAAVVLSAAASILAYPLLPARVAIHWNLAGEPDGYSGRLFAAAFAPAISAGLLMLLLFLPKFEPKRNSIRKNLGYYSLLAAGLSLFFLGIHLLVLLNGLGADLPVGGLVIFLIGALFILLGRILPGIEPNYFIGLRTPWTLESPAVWRATHRAGGTVFTLLGILAMAAGLFNSGLLIFLAATLAGTAGLLVQSYLLFRRRASRKG